MKQEDARKQNAELNEEELDGVSGGYSGGFPAGASTMPFQSGMQMDPATMQYQPGADRLQAATLEQRKRGANPANPMNPVNTPKPSGGAHSI